MAGCCLFSASVREGGSGCDCEGGDGGGDDDGCWGENCCGAFVGEVSEDLFELAPQETKLLTKSRIIKLATIFLIHRERFIGGTRISLDVNIYSSPPGDGESTRLTFRKD